MSRRAFGAAVAAVLLLQGAPARGWDLFGHHVVGAVAWEELEPSVRTILAELLLGAPSDSDLPGLLPGGPRPHEERAREHFIKAQGWADLVRDEIWSRRKERYDRPDWHYVNRYWTPTPAGPKALPERGTLGELSRQFPLSLSEATDPRAAVPDRAIALAWVLHLSGDAHQPLHSSGRVTERDPAGDRGGNEFALDDLETPNLHAFWDSILRIARRQQHRESYFRWVSRVASELSALHPRDSFRRELTVDSAEEWSKESVALAMERAYPADLARGSAPPERYRDAVWKVAARQAALAGYRQARLLNAAFAGQGTSR